MLRNLNEAHGRVIELQNVFRGYLGMGIDMGLGMGMDLEFNLFQVALIGLLLSTTNQVSR